MDIQKTLSERGTTHGDYQSTATLSQNLKYSMAASNNWGILSFGQREALEMVQHKIARILTGDPNFVDAWRDCIGYLQLAVNELSAKPGATDVRNVKLVLTDKGWVDQ
jgi:hypothetical protein